jgi:hypothetical protein
MNTFSALPALQHERWRQTPGTRIATRYQTYLARAQRLSREQALDHLLLAYLPQAVYALPAVLARHLRLPEQELRAGLERLCASGQAEVVHFAEQKRACYLWRENEDAMK